MPTSLQDSLSYHLPVDAVDHVAKLLMDNRIKLRITRHRNSKLGDFRPSTSRSPHRLSINGSLNRYEFLLVFLHEFAHLKIYERFGKQTAPHGKEWKSFYGMLIRDFISRGCFHPTLADPLTAYSYRVKASGVADIEVARLIRAFDEPAKTGGEWMFLEEIPTDGLFRLNNGRLFVKAGKLRTRYRCRCAQSGKFFLVHGEARVYPAKTSQVDSNIINT